MTSSISFTFYLCVPGDSSFCQILYDHTTYPPAPPSPPGPQSPELPPVLPSLCPEAAPAWPSGPPDPSPAIAKAKEFVADIFRRAKEAKGGTSAEVRPPPCPGPSGSLVPPPFPQERLEAARQASSEARKQSSSLGEQLQTLRGELADLELRRAEAEGQRQQLQEVRARALPTHLHLLPRLGPASRRPCSSFVRVPITQVQRLRSQGSFPTVGLLIAASSRRLAEQLASSPPA